MDHCVQCGHELGVGRYCTNCGRPVDASPSWRTDTAERGDRAGAAPEPAPDAAPPPAWTSPPPARFPLYADEVPGRPEHPHSEPPTAPPAPPVADAPAATPTPHRRRPLGLWIAAAAVAVLVTVVGVVLTTSDDDPSARDDTSSDAAKDDGDDGTDGSDGGSGGVANLATTASVEVPATAGPGQDVDGNPVGFDGENMLDAVPETAWRMPGDGTGEEIVVTLAAESHLRSVGMINGYAKKAQDRDWYHGNRRVEEVEWVFDDGTTVVQQLGDDTGVQSVDVDVTTTGVTIRLLSVSKPGSGPSARDFTAISDLSLVGES
jgi:hypothetical protein